MNRFSFTIYFFLREMMKNHFFYVGTKSLPTEDAAIPPSRGIYGFSLDAQTGELSPHGLMAEAKSPAFLAKHPFLDVIYAIADSENPSRKDGIVIAFRRDAATGTLHRLNALHTEGAGATHLSVHPDGNDLFTANFHSGTVSFFALKPDGSLDRLTQLITFTGHGPNSTRQAVSHPHWIHADPAGRFVLMCDLGADRIHSYCRSDERTAWVPNENQPYATVTSGAGCRHAAFSPDGRFLFVVNEITSTLDVFHYAPETGILTGLQTVSILPSGFFGQNSAAAIAVSPGGKFLYVSSRGADLITVFELSLPEITSQNSPDAGFSGIFATPIQFFPSGGSRPRFIMLDPTGRFLLVFNKKSHNIRVFRIHPETGLLADTGHHAAVPWGVGATFL